MTIKLIEWLESTLIKCYIKHCQLLIKDLCAGRIHFVLSLSPFSSISLDYESVEKRPHWRWYSTAVEESSGAWYREICNTEQHFSAPLLSEKGEQQMRDGSRGKGREVLKGVGSVTRVIVQFDYWYPHSHEGRELLLVLQRPPWSPASSDVGPPQGRSCSTPGLRWSKQSIGAIDIHNVYISVHRSALSGAVCVINLALVSSGCFHGYQW